LVGFCCEGDKRLLVYEHMLNGSLDAHLFQSDAAVVLDWSTRYQIAKGVAKGMSYLHQSCRECIIYCDIKPENILLDASFVPKIGLLDVVLLIVACIVLSSSSCPAWSSSSSPTSSILVARSCVVLLAVTCVLVAVLLGCLTSASLGHLPPSLLDLWLPSPRFLNPGNGF
jgi:serine/threonine protein kinase